MTTSEERGVVTLLTTQEVSELLGLQPRTLANWRWRGYGPRYLNLGGRRIRYRLRDVEAFLESEVRTSTSNSHPGQAAGSYL